MEIEEIGKLWIIIHYMEIYAGVHAMTRQENGFKMERGVRCCEGDQENEREEFGLFNLEKKL